jgi:hypothetical protein
MTNLLRHFCCFIFIASIISLIAVPAMAKTSHHKQAHRAIHHTATHSSHSSHMVMTAQQHLVDLGYLTEHPDGILGPKTALALKHFQRDHKFRADGKLTTQTYNALVEMSMESKSVSTMGANAPSPTPPADFYGNNKDFYGHYNQQYQDPMLLSSGVAGDGSNAPIRSQAIASRFAKIDMSENGQGPAISYIVTVNGQPLLRSDDQPSVIGVSKTYDLGDEDAIIFSTYRSFDPVCTYKHYLLITNQSGNNVQQIDNCTRGYQAIVKEGSLFVTFPDFDANRAIGSVWRYEKGSLQKL